MRILVVEDDQKIAGAIKRGLSRQSYAVDIGYDTEEADGYIDSFNYDLIILDRMLPGGVDGLGLLKKIRKSGNQTPVLFLTAKDKILDKAEGLNAGADDYLAKPFSYLELLARVRALLRRPKAGLSEVLEISGLSLDVRKKTVHRADKEIELSSKEFALLEYFMRHPDIVVSKEALIENVWDFDSNVLPSTVEVYINYLREKIEKPFSELGALIHTKRGFGYYFGEK
ncbi:MAG: response regulator transcription factor [Patescibacteria group bacterium]